MLSLIISIRGFLAFLMLVSAFTGPLWLTFLFGLALAARYRAWEVVVIAVCMDMIWLPESVSLHLFPMNTLVAIVLVLILEPLRRELMIRTHTL